MTARALLFLALSSATGASVAVAWRSHVELVRLVDLAREIGHARTHLALAARKAAEILSAPARERSINE